MKKYAIWILTLIATFSLSLVVIVVYYFSTAPEVAELPMLSVPEKFDCRKSEIFPGISKDIEKIEKGKVEHFPRDLFDNHLSPNKSKAGWYGKNLRLMKEKTLLNNVSFNEEIYRFLWLRTFDHPISIRVERSGNSYSLISKELDGEGGYEPGKIMRTDNFSLSEDEWCEFIRLIEKAEFWRLPTETEDWGNDGAQWVLEGVKNNRYHTIDRWSPESGGFREACVYLIKLSGRDIDKMKDDLY